MGAATVAAVRSRADGGGICGDGRPEVSEAEELMMTEPLMGVRRGETIPKGDSRPRRVDGNMVDGGARLTNRIDPKREVDDAPLAVKKCKKRKYHQGTLPTPDLMATSEHIGEGGHEEEITRKSDPIYLGST